MANATADADSFEEVSHAVDAVAQSLPGQITEPGSGAAERPAAGAPRSGARAESMLSSASVGYVAWAVPGFRYEDPLNGPTSVLGHLLSTGYLWEKVRMEGGAYGAYSYPRNTDGLFLFGSYRDPHITGTLQAFRDALGMVEKGSLDKGEVEKAVIGTIGREDRPIDPGEKGFVSLQRKLHGVTDPARQARRDNLLASDAPALARVARGLLGGSARGFTAVIANRQSLAEAAAQIPALSQNVIDLPE